MRITFNTDHTVLIVSNYPVVEITDEIQIAVDGRMITLIRKLRGGGKCKQTA